MLLLMPTAAFSLTVGNASALLLALSDASVDRIDVLPGHYLLNHELVVSRSLTVAAAEGGVVTLMADSTWANDAGATDFRRRTRIVCWSSARMPR